MEHLSLIFLYISCWCIANSHSFIIHPLTKFSGCGVSKICDNLNPIIDTEFISGPSTILSQKPIATNSTTLQMLSFYCFKPVMFPTSCRDMWFNSIKDIPGLRGSVYVASEGINAQMAIPPEYLDDFLHHCSNKNLFPFDKIPPNLGDTVSIKTPTFDKLIVRVRDFVLRDGLSQETNLDWEEAGPELEAQEWQRELSSNEDRVLIDCRNLYESTKGTFQDALPLGTDTFKQSWDRLDLLTKDLPRDKPFYIFCTGGIRCVKVGAYLKQKLKFENVSRLKHGIISYQKWVSENPDEVSIWQGENFLFDKRRLEKDENNKVN